MALPVVVWQTNREHISKKKDLPQMLYHTFLVFSSNQGQAPKKEESTSAALIHISWVLWRSGIWWNASGMVRIISLHISMVFKWFRTNNIMYSLLRTTSLHISWVLRCSGTYANQNDSIITASMHISCVLRCLGTYTKERGFMRIVSMHISCVLRWSET